MSGLDAMMSSESPILSVVQLGARWLLSRLLRGAGCWEESAVLPRTEQNVILVQPSKHCVETENGSDVKSQVSVYVELWRLDPALIMDGGSED